MPATAVHRVVVVVVAAAAAAVAHIDWSIHNSQVDVQWEQPGLELKCQRSRK